MSAGQKGPALRIDRLDVDGYSVRVAVRPGLGTPLLIFNGVGGNLELLSPFIQAVPGMEVVVFDLPGLVRYTGPIASARWPASRPRS